MILHLRQHHHDHQLSKPRQQLKINMMVLLLLNTLNLFSQHNCRKEESYHCFWVKLWKIFTKILRKVFVSILILLVHIFGNSCLFYSVIMLHAYMELTRRMVLEHVPKLIWHHLVNHVEVTSFFLLKIRTFIAHMEISS